MKSVQQLVLLILMYTFYALSTVPAVAVHRGCRLPGRRRPLHDKPRPLPPRPQCGPLLQGPGGPGPQGPGQGAGSLSSEVFAEHGGRQGLPGRRHLHRWSLLRLGNYMENILKWRFLLANDGEKNIFNIFFEEVIFEILKIYKIQIYSNFNRFSTVHLIRNFIMFFGRCC